LYYYYYKFFKLINEKIAYKNTIFVSGNLEINIKCYLKLYFYGKKFRSKVQGKENLKIQKTLINIFIFWKEI
jgi:hypothetical protein